MKIGITFEFTEGEKKMFDKLLKQNNPCLRQGFGRQVCVLCGEVFDRTETFNRR